MVFERTADHHLIVGQKRRGERVAFVAPKAFAVEAELNSFGFVQKATACG
jgi:hypothetical protein